MSKLERKGFNGTPRRAFGFAAAFAVATAAICSASNYIGSSQAQTKPVNNVAPAAATAPAKTAVPLPVAAPNKATIRVAAVGKRRAVAARPPAREPATDTATVLAARAATPPPVVKVAARHKKVVPLPRKAPRQYSYPYSNEYLSGNIQGSVEFLAMMDIMYGVKKPFGTIMRAPIVGGHIVFHRDDQQFYFPPGAHIPQYNGKYVEQFDDSRVIAIQGCRIPYEHHPLAKGARMMGIAIPYVGTGASVAEWLGDCKIATFEHVTRPARIIISAAFGYVASKIIRYYRDNNIRPYVYKKEGPKLFAKYRTMYGRRWALWFARRDAIIKANRAGRLFEFVAKKAASAVTRPAAKAAVKVIYGKNGRRLRRQGKHRRYRGRPPVQMQQQRGPDRHRRSSTNPRREQLLNSTRLPDRSSVKPARGALRGATGFGF